MQIEVENPEFLLSVLNDEMLRRISYLVDQGIAYDSDWRDGFVELILVMRQLNAPKGDKLEEAVP